MSPRAQSTRVKVIKRPSSRQNSNSPRKNVAPSPSEDGTAGSEGGGSGESDEYLVEDDDFDEKSLHSDALDEDSDPEVRPARVGGKRKRPTPVKPHVTKGRTPRKKRKSADSDEEEEDYDLKEGQEIVGKVVEAPKTGRGTYCLYMRRDDQRPICLVSSARPDFSKHIQLPLAAKNTRVQRPRVVSVLMVLLANL